jgi:ribosomal biogenesis protein LAS1
MLSCTILSLVVKHIFKVSCIEFFLCYLQAFDWLGCIYWDRQTDSIPDPHVELTLRLHEIAHFLKSNDSKKSKSGSKRKREYRQLIERIVAKPALFSLFLYDQGY